MAFAKRFDIRRDGAWVLLTLLVAFIESPLVVAAPPGVSEKWVARYDAGGIDKVTAMRVDAGGNTYVTGHSVGLGTGSDYVTIKYDADGHQLWLARTDGGDGNHDEASALAIDAIGNVYVTGYADLSGLGPRFFTVKYDSHGRQLWIHREQDAYLAEAIAVDANGNAYVTGNASTFKYDDATNHGPYPVWSTSETGLATAIALDPDGNVYVTGSFEDPWVINGHTVIHFGYQSIRAFKFAPDGTRLWSGESVCNRSPQTVNCEPKAIAVDASGHAYVTGENNGDFVTLAFDTLASASPSWVVGGLGQGQGANAIALDKHGNVYVTGTGGGGSGDYVTIKYDRDGNRLWDRSYFGPLDVDTRDVATAIALDATGNVYVTGSSVGTVDHADYTTIKYDPNGNARWLVRYDGPGAETDADGDRAEAIGVDAAGNVYVSGFTTGAGGTADYTTIKYVQADVGILTGSSAPGPVAVNLTTMGSADWREWGLVDATTDNHKAGVAPQISALTALGPGTARFGNDPLWNRVSWTDGTPTVSKSKVSSGVYFQGNGNGYELKVVADTKQRTLTLYVGGWMSTSRIRATLSDGSTVPFVTSFGNASGIYAQVVTLNFRANSSGQTLTVRHTQDGKDGNIGLQAATLSQQAAVNAPPSIEPIAKQVVTAGQFLHFIVMATDADGPFPLAMTIKQSVPDLPATAEFDSGSGIASFNWTPSEADIGNYDVTFAATDGAGRSAQQTVRIVVAAIAGTLQGNLAVASSLVNLTTIGTDDWVHWGLVDAMSVNRKAGVTPQIGSVKVLRGGAPGRFGNDPTWTKLGWTDGAPTPAVTKFSGGIYVQGIENGFRLTVPADRTQRTLKLYVGGWMSAGFVGAQLSDHSANTISLPVGDTNTTYSNVVTLTFAAASDGQTLEVVLIQETKTGNVGLQAAALTR